MARVAVKLVLLFLLVYAGVFLYYNRLEKRWLAGTGQPVKMRTEESRVAAGKDTEPPDSAPATQDFQIIVTRNIFQASLESTVQKPAAEIEELAPTSLDLTLLGTVTGNERDARAIIVDNKENKQDLYQVGDAVQGAFIESIERGKITLDVNGNKEALLIKEREGGGPGPPDAVQPRQRLVPGERSEINAARKVPRARPHRRITFRKDPDQPEIEPEVMENGSLSQDLEEEGELPGEEMPADAE